MMNPFKFVLAVTLGLIVCVSTQSADKTITFTAVGDDGFEGTASLYIVYLDTIEFDSTNYFNADSTSFCGSPLPSGSTEECILKNLIGSKKYFCGVVVVDDAGNRSKLSNVIIFETPDDIAPATIFNLRLLR